MGARRGGTMVAGLVLAGAVVAACGTEAEPEVAGVVLERDADEGAAAPVEEDEDLPEGPLVLAAITSDLGVHHVYGDEGVELGSGQVLEDEPVTRHLVADALVDGDRVRCQATLHAPANRAMVVAGELTVSLVLEARGGEVEVQTQQALEVDVVVDAGDSVALDPSPPRQVDTSGLRALWCEAVHAPR